MNYKKGSGDSVYKEIQFKNIKFVIRYSLYDVTSLFILISTIFLQVNLLVKINLCIFALIFNYIGWRKYKLQCK